MLLSKKYLVFLFRLTSCFYLLDLMFHLAFAYTSWRNLKRILNRKHSLKKKNYSAVPALFFHTMLIVSEYFVQMVGCIFAEGFFFSSQVHRHDLEFVMLYS